VEIFVGYLLLPWEGFLYDVLEAGMDSAEGQVVVPYRCFVVVAREVALPLAVEEVKGLSYVFLLHEDLSIDNGREELVPIDFAITIDVHGIKEASYLLFVFEVHEEVLFDVLKCNIPVGVVVELEEHLPELLCIVLAYLATISDNVVYALPKDAGLTIRFQPLKCLHRYGLR
jgi:hypothetical protein